MSAEPFRAYVKEDFVFEVGPDKTRVEVPRLFYKDAPDVLNVIARVMAEDKQASFAFIEKARSFATYQDKTSKAVEKAIGEIVPRLLLQRNHGVVQDLFAALTYKRFTPEIIATMQVNEAAEILAYLVRHNFASLKNLWASLEAMKTSVNESNDE